MRLLSLSLGRCRISRSLSLPLDLADECINIAEALDSCGGCASTGEGLDCTKIRGAAGVGCSAGTCVVFSCKTGYRPSLSGDRCVRMRSSHGAAGNHTRSSNAQRHIAARHHTGAAFH